MGLFNRKRRDAPPPPPTYAQQLTQFATAGAPALTAHSEFVKKSVCSQCGGTKQLPSVTAYVYCDYCGALMDFDFRLANANTNAGLTNTVYHHLAAPWQASMARARAAGDVDGFRMCMRAIYTEWVRQCPQAVSPRCANDQDFRERMITYLVESATSKEMDPRQQPLEAEMQARTNALVRIPMGPNAWRVANGFWEMAELYKRQMEFAYAHMAETGVLALDPDQAPVGVPLRMEYSIFCQAWLPHISPEEGERLLELYGLTGSYEKYVEIDTQAHAVRRLRHASEDGARGFGRDLRRLRTQAGHRRRIVVVPGLRCTARLPRWRQPPAVSVLRGGHRARIG